MKINKMDNIFGKRPSMLQSIKTDCRNFHDKKTIIHIIKQHIFPWIIIEKGNKNFLKKVEPDSTKNWVLKSTNVFQILRCYFWQRKCYRKSRTQLELIQVVVIPSKITKAIKEMINVYFLLARVDSFRTVSFPALCHHLH